MALGRADLKWVLSDNEVSEEVRGVIYHAGFCKMSIFLGLGESRREVRDTLKAEFNLDVDESLEIRAQVSRLLAAWDAARLH
eukprot:6486171-Karenia_brevis.AAC.1